MTFTNQLKLQNGPACLNLQLNERETVYTVFGRNYSCIWLVFGLNRMPDEELALEYIEFQFIFVGENDVRCWFTTISVRWHSNV